ncbi:GNAT family N-acetyltransferase [Demequina sp.]|uniref:GNAT family N-acetyltransferase n=1 Tax=Demequina sp. TaxID=2050685 RepID=UPI0025BF0385|nr:GNAT family N-acetyltransferase [Demequina sp.]
MTDSLLRRGQYSLAPAQRRDVAESLELCAADDVANVVPAMHLETAARAGIVPTGLWVVRRRGRLSSQLAGVLWCGANLTATLPTEGDETDDARAEVASAIVARLSRPAALVGDAELTLDLWGRIEPWWGPARQLRPSQVSMVIRDDPKAVKTPPTGMEPLQRASLDDYAQLLPAAAHMFLGEVGYDPLQHGREAYEERLAHLVRAGRSYVMYGDVNGKRDIVFKAEVGVVGGGVAQIQGVWVQPSLRGCGYGSAGMAQLVEHVRQDHAEAVSLYVNDFNAAAIGAYESAGFERVGTFATVMF